ncbi:MAG: hypothetical protein K1X57_11680 [Gemmataceae bacterium]|nr:hypothetical protein [Gemmataceae bacterium]
MKHDPVAALERLASRANGEPASSSEVADRVLATLRSNTTATIPLERDYLLVGTGSLVAACAASFLFWVAVADDSLLSLAQPFIMVMP